MVLGRAFGQQCDAILNQRTRLHAPSIPAVLCFQLSQVPSCSCQWSSSCSLLDLKLLELSQSWGLASLVASPDWSVGARQSERHEHPERMEAVGKIQTKGRCRPTCK